MKAAADSVSSPFDVLNQADKSDQQKVPTLILVGIILAAAGLGSLVR